jgi:hypothetical protein
MHSLQAMDKILLGQSTLNHTNKYGKQINQILVAVNGQPLTHGYFIKKISKIEMNNPKPMNCGTI